MKLQEVLAGCKYEPCGRTSGARDADENVLTNNAEVSAIAYDSRKVTAGSVFVVIRGSNFDGKDFIGDAVKRGAVAIVCETTSGMGLPAADINLSSPEGLLQPVFVKVKDSRKALACISHNFYGRPSGNATVIGVTGTNGKTTTTYLIKSILEAWKKETGLIGTIGYLIGDREYPALHTTPEAPEFQKLLCEMVQAGCSYVVTEVSSHALFQKRVDYTKFDVAVFTNLTRDHLDFHGTMENYYNAKELLFTELLSATGSAVICTDDAWGRRLSLKLIEEDTQQKQNSIITYGIDSAADVTASDIENSLSGVSFSLKCRGGRFKVASPLIGVVNVYNMLAAAATAVALNIPIDVIREGIGNIAAVNGRLERINEGQDFLCIIDYAHTPDAMERLVSTARELVDKTGSATHRSGSRVQGQPGSVITVFGCGGNRDIGKRPVMGEIASRLSDYVVITSDNPRREDPLRIIKDIEMGIAEDNYVTIPDRKEAINTAVEKAETGDIVIIAGKGHEDYQELGDIRHRFSDSEVAREAIKNKLSRYKLQDAG